SPSILERMHRSRDARQRMKQPGGRLGAKLAINRVPDRVHIGDEVLPRMPFGGMQRVMPVVAEIEDDHFVTLAQRSPEWKITVDRKPVAVTEHKARRAGETVLANMDCCAVLHLHIEGVTRARHMMRRLMFVRLVHSLTASLPDRCRRQEKCRRAPPTVQLRRALRRSPRASVSIRAILPSPATGSAA